MATAKKWYERVNWGAFAFILLAVVALHYGAKHNMSADQIVAGAGAIALLAAQFRKLIDLQPPGDT